MNEAHKVGLTLQAEASYMENQYFTKKFSKSLEELKAFEESYTKIGRKGETKSKAGAGMARLPTLQGGYNNDPRIISELENLKQENEALNDKIKKLEKRMLEIAKSKSDLEVQAEEDVKTGAEISGSSLAAKDQELNELRKELEKRISQTSQVVSMKKIIQQKNEQINELKERLKKYEKVN